MKAKLKIITVILLPVLVTNLLFPYKVLALTQFGQSADIVVGQPSFESNLSNNGGDTALFEDTQLLITVGDKFIATGWDKNKVLIWNSIPVSGAVVPDIVLGQPDLTTDTPNYGGLSSKSLYRGNGLASDGTRLFVSDWENNRILVWNTIPTTNFKEADYVLGQADFTSSSCLSPSATTLCKPNNIIIDSGKFIVADGGNHRVLIWDTIPNSNLVPADHVIGQTNMTSNTNNSGGLSDKSLSTPDKLYVHGGKLFISEWANHRVMVYNTVPASDFAPADIVIGQPGFVTNGINQGGISAATVSIPGQVTVGSDNKLYVVDRNNNRVLVWNTVPTSNGTSADYVIGQPDMTSNTANNGGLTSKSMQAGDGIMSHGSKLYVSDGNIRVLVFDVSITQNFQEADHVIGQDNFTEINGTQKGLDYPTGAIVINGKLVVADTDNSRILIYGGFPSIDYQSPSLVIGQPNLSSITSNYGGISDRSLSSYVYISTDGERLLVSDYGNHRVLIFNTLPTQNFQAADLVLGQPGFVTGDANHGGISGSTLSGPENLYTEAGKLVVADYGNSRVLIWNTFPTTNGQSADVVVGQPNMSSNTPNNGGLSAKSLSWPYDAILSNGKLIVTDYDNNRILIFDSIPQVDFAEADHVIGQETMSTDDNNHAGLSASSLRCPLKSTVDEYGHLWVMDSCNQRVMMWDSIPSSDFATADVVIGQPNFVSLENNWDSLALPNRFEWAESVDYWNNKLLVSDSENNRVIIFRLGPVISTIDASDALVAGSATITTSSTEAAFMKVSTDSTFAGASWVPYASSYVFSDFTTDNSTKHLYVKFKGSNYEYETDTYSFEIAYATSPSTTSSSSQPEVPQIPQSSDRGNGGGIVTPIKDSNTGGQKITVQIEQETFSFDAYLSSTSYTPSFLQQVLIGSSNTTSSPDTFNNSLYRGSNATIAGGSVLGVQTDTGIAWQVGPIQKIYYKAYPPFGSGKDPAIIIPSLQEKPSNLALSYTDTDLTPPGDPKHPFSPSTLKLAHSSDGITWKILQHSVVDAVNHTVAVIDTIGGYYVIVSTTKKGTNTIETAPLSVTATDNTLPIGMSESAIPTHANISPIPSVATSNRMITPTPSPQPLSMSFFHRIVGWVKDIISQ